MPDDTDTEEIRRRAICEEAEEYIPGLGLERPEPNGADDEPPPDYDKRAGPPAGAAVDPDKKKAAEHWWEERQPWNVTRPSEWADKQVEPRVFIMEDWIPLGEYIALYGAAGVRKTDFLLQALMATSAGLYFCGCKMRHSVTFGVFCEDSEKELLRRIDRIAAFYGRTRADFTGFFFVSLAQAVDTEFVNFENGRMHISDAFVEFEKLLSKVQAGFAVLDTIADFFGGEEINRRQIARFLRLLTATGMRNHCAIMGTRHPSQRGKSTGTYESGSTGWEAKERARLVLRDPAFDPTGDGEEYHKSPIARLPSQKRILTRAKANYALPGIELSLIFENGGFDVERAADTPKGKVRDLGADAKFLELLRDVRQAGRYVHNAPSAHQYYAPSVFGNHPNHGNFSESEFKRAMRRLEGSGRILLKRVGSAAKGHYEYEENQEFRPNGPTSVYQ
jgi:RecA-family ATPase